MGGTGGVADSAPDSTWVGWRLPGLRFRKRLVYSSTAFLVVLMVLPFVVGIFTTNGVYAATAGFGIIATIFMTMPLFYFGLDVGIAMDQLAEVTGGILTVQTLRGPRSIDVTRLSVVTTWALWVGFELWTLKDTDGRAVRFVLSPSGISTGRTDQVLRQALAASPDATVSPRVSRALDAVPRYRYGRFLGPANLWVTFLAEMAVGLGMVGLYMWALASLIGF